MKQIFLFLSVCWAWASIGAAAPGLITECYGTSPRFPGFHIQLYEDQGGKLSASYTLGSYPISPAPWTNAGQVTTPPVSFPKLLEKANQQQDTGIRADQVKLFQMIFLDGSDRWDVELWKLMGADGSLIGWMAYAYGDPIGCASPQPLMAPQPPKTPKVEPEPECEDLSGIYSIQRWANAPIGVVMIMQHKCEVISRTFLLTDPDRRLVVTSSYHDHLDMKKNPDPSNPATSRASLIDYSIVITYITQPGKQTIEEHWQVIRDVLYVTHGHRNPIDDSYVIDAEEAYNRFNPDTSPIH